MSAPLWLADALSSRGLGTAVQLHLDRGDAVIGTLQDVRSDGVLLSADGGSAMVPWDAVRWVMIEGPARKKLEAAEARRKPKTKVTA